MIELIAVAVALVAAGLILGIVGFGLVGQLRRLRTSLTALRTDVLPRGEQLAAALARPAYPAVTPADPAMTPDRTAGRHRTNDG